MTARLPVLRLAGASADVGRALAALAGWGAPPVEAVDLPVAGPPDPGRYAAQGGMTDGPWGSRGLVRALFDGLPDAARAAVADAPEQIVIVTPRGFHPHTWGPTAGGVHLGRGRWVRRYAIVPDGAPWGHAAHELGHLLHAWPDLAHVGSLECLMSRGADRDGGRDPSPPCAALRAPWVGASALDGWDGAGLFHHEVAEMTIVGELRGGALHAQLLGDDGLPVRAATAPIDRGVRAALDPAIGRWLAEARRRAAARREVDERRRS